MGDILFNEPLKYKQLSELMNEEPSQGGRNRTLQLNRWKQFYEIEKIDNNKYIIKREYGEQEQINNLPEIKRLKLKSFIVPKELENSSGVYKIQYKNIIYIGQTNDFYDRFYRHRQSKSKAYELILKGGTFEIIELVENLNERLKKEKMYIQKYCEDKNYVCINSDFNYINPNRKKRTFKGRKTKYKNIKVLYEDYNKIIDFLEKEDMYYE